MPILNRQESTQVYCGRLCYNPTDPLKPDYLSSLGRIALLPPSPTKDPDCICPKPDCPSRSFVAQHLFEKLQEKLPRR